MTQVVWVVCAGYVTVETAVPGGRAHVDITRGQHLPADVSGETIQALHAAGSISPWKPRQAAAASGEPVDQQADVPPDGTVADILAWVGDHPGRAHVALAAEKGRGTRARSTLTARLADIGGRQ